MNNDRVLDTALLVALAAGMGLALRLVVVPSPVAYVPVMTAADSTQAMQSPGGAERALDARLAQVGDYVTVEDLARGALAIEQGRLPGVAPLSESERAALEEQVAKADQHRKDLLAAEAELARAEAEQDATARQIAATLTPEQKAWVLAQRDNVSVGGVEAAYWEELAAALSAPAVKP